MAKPWLPPERRGQDWQDRPLSRDDREPVYPDGTPKYECWNAASLRITPAGSKKPLRPAVEEEEEEP